MLYEESNTVELKRTMGDDMKSEILAFLNSYLGGSIYVGVEKDGRIYESSLLERDENESKVINWIRDEAIYPNCSEFVKMSYNQDNILVIEILPGDKKPYYLKAKGMKPSGVYIRYGRNKSQASQEEIARMIRETHNEMFEDLISKHQELSFNTLRKKFEEKQINFENFKLLTSGFLNKGTNLYTNLAFWFSDQYNIETKMAVYQGLDRDTFRSKKEFNGSIIKQIDQVLEYYDLCNEVRVIIDGSPMRTEIPSYEARAAREGILNCFCHRDYSRKSNIKIEFFDDRCEIISPGGFYDGLTLEEALSGVQSFRNENLVKLLFKLGYIENYASGLSRIFREYEKDKSKPIIESFLVALKLTLPNRNYEAFSKKENMSLAYLKKVTPDTGSRNDALNGALNGVLNDTLNDALKPEIKRLYMAIKSYPKINRKELSKILIISESTIDRQLLVLLNKKYIERIGGRKDGGYTIIEDNKGFVYESSNPSNGALNDTLNDALNDTLNPSTKRLLLIIKMNPDSNRKSLSNILKISESTIDKQLKILLDKELIVRIGSRKDGGYHIKNKGNT